MISTIALVDRTFQQRRLLEGRSTVNVGLKTQLIMTAHNLDSGGDKKSQNDNEIDITHTKTEEPPGDKPMQEGEEGS